MQNELLLEVFSEEIPALLQKDAAIFLADNFTKKAREYGLHNFNVNYYYGPRRLILHVENLPQKLEQKSELIKGPALDANENAVNGFLNKYGLDSVSDLVIEEVKNKKYYFYNNTSKTASITEILVEVIKFALQKLQSFWPKTMRWGNYKTKWIRPLHNILALYNQEILNFELWHLEANDFTFIHRQLESLPVQVVSFADYSDKLRLNKVEISATKRKQLILTDLHDYAENLNCELVEDKALLEEVVGLVEYPHVMLGEIPKEFLSLPKEVLVTSMRNHQKYFSLSDKSGNIAPYFLFVSNVSSEFAAKIIAGNEKVLKARLSDAIFFYRIDNNTSLKKRKNLLKNVVFHKDIGSVYAKSENVKALAKLISIWIPHSNILDVETAADICKSDLTTEIVGEFPEMQGIAGYYYAKFQSYNDEVAFAIKEHYLPVGINSELPERPVSLCIALADKLDSLVSLFAIGQKPSSSKDPFALRRQAIGIIRIITERNIYFPLQIALDKAVKPYSTQAKHNYKKANKLFNNSEACLKGEVLDFIFDRFFIIMQKHNFDTSLLKAICANRDIDDLNLIKTRCEILQDFIDSGKLEDALAAYKRAYNIVIKSDNKDDSFFSKKPNKILFQDQHEKNLFLSVKKFKNDSQVQLKNGDFAVALAEIGNLVKPINDFFAEVQVYSDDKSLQENRLKLLAYLCNNVNRIANFSYLESK